MSSLININKEYKKMLYKQKMKKNGVWTLHAALVNLFKIKHGVTAILTCEIFYQDVEVKIRSRPCCLMNPCM